MNTGEENIKALMTTPQIDPILAKKIDKLINVKYCSQWEVLDFSNEELEQVHQYMQDLYLSTKKKVQIANRLSKLKRESIIIPEFADDDFI